MNVIEIQNLVRKAKRHDPDAFTKLMQYYAKDMYRTAIAILMNDEDAADAIHGPIQESDLLEIGKVIEIYAA